MGCPKTMVALGFSVMAYRPDRVAPDLLDTEISFQFLFSSSVRGFHHLTIK
jgi:hypothetical protein